MGVVHQEVPVTRSESVAKVEGGARNEGDEYEAVIRIRARVLQDDPNIDEQDWRRLLRWERAEVARLEEQRLRMGLNPDEEEALQASLGCVEVLEGHLSGHDPGGTSKLSLVG